MKVIAWNRFPGFYVVSDDEDSFDGLKFHFHGEAVEECEEWIQKNFHGDLFEGVK